MNPAHRTRPDRFDALAMLLLLAIVPAICAPVLRHAIRGTPTIAPDSDFPTHSVLAAELRAQRRIMIPHPLYHLALIGVQWGGERFRPVHQSETAKSAVSVSRGKVSDEVLAEINHQYGTAAIILNVFLVWLLAVIVWVQIRTAGSLHTVGGVVVGIALVTGLIILTPLALLHAQDGRYYLGYIGINVWHNPTVIAAKPFAYLTFLATLAGFPGQSKAKARVTPCGILAFAAIVVLGATVKPSFLMCLVPAACFVAACRQFWFRRPVRWTYLLMGLVLPTLIVLAWQSRIYTRYTGGAHATFSPLLTMSILSRHLGLKLGLSIVFPVACYLAWWKVARSRTRLNLAWLAFAVGLVYTYFVAETQRVAHGNFLWGAQLALLILFVESTLFIVEKARSATVDAAEKNRDRRRATACLIIFALHVLFGVIYCTHLASNRRGTNWLTGNAWYH